MKQLYLDIKSQIQYAMPQLRHVAIENGQIEAVNQDESVPEDVFPMPAVFVSFPAPIMWKQLGNGVQIAEPLTIRVRLAMNELDAGNGAMDENTNIFDLKDRLFLALQDFEPNGAGKFVRSSEEQDFDHNNMYVYAMEFTTTFIDPLSKRPRGGISKPAPTDLTTVEFTPPPPPTP